MAESTSPASRRSVSSATRAPEQLQRYDRDGLVQHEAIEFSEAAAVLDAHEPRLRRRPVAVAAAGRGASDRDGQGAAVQLARGRVAAAGSCARPLAHLGAGGLEHVGRKRSRAVRACQGTPRAS
jgi:hypothetical protein